jgi:hypothetical protein
MIVTSGNGVEVDLNSLEIEVPKRRGETTPYT